jgi:hypothetical protein
MGARSEDNSVAAIDGGFALAGDYSDSVDGGAPNIFVGNGNGMRVSPNFPGVTNRARVVVPAGGGSFYVVGESDFHPMVAKFNGALNFDTFGTNGVATFPAEQATQVRAAVADAQGNLIVLYQNAAGPRIRRVMVATNPPTIDPGFLPAPANGVSVRGLAVTSQGDVLVAGTSAANKLFVAKFNGSDGGPMTMTSTTDVKVGPGLNGGNGLLVDSTGRIYVSAATTTATARLRVLRLLPDGTPDVTFGAGQDGIAAVDAPCQTAACLTACASELTCTPGMTCGGQCNPDIAMEGRSLALQPDGHVVLFGYAASSLVGEELACSGSCSSSPPAGDAVVLARFW